MHEDDSHTTSSSCSDLPLIDLDATGDAVRTDHAFHEFLTTIEDA
jgi:hypothetical protein